MYNNYLCFSACLHADKSLSMFRANYLIFINIRNTISFYLAVKITYFLKCITNNGNYLQYYMTNLYQPEQARTLALTST